MHRAKHRAGAGAGPTVLATTLLERFAVVPEPRRPLAEGAPAQGHALFGATPRTASVLAVGVVDVAPTGPAPLFDDAAPEVSPFGAARHAARPRSAAIPAPRPPTPPALPVRSQPVGVTVSATVLGAAAAVTAVVAPAPTAVETTGSLAPVQSPAPAPAAPAGVAPALPAPAAALALPDLPTMQVNDLVTHVTGEMQKVDRPYTTVAQSRAMTSPAAMRKAAMTNALAKLGTPYRWGAMGPNAFDCSGLVKWSFANAGRSLPRTSRAMAGVGVPVTRANLQPGDLVFFYKPISHVGIYIGNGKIVHASRSGQPVKISDMAGMRFSAARRVV